MINLKKEDLGLFSSSFHYSVIFREWLVKDFELGYHRESLCRLQSRRLIDELHAFKESLRKYVKVRDGFTWETVDTLIFTIIFRSSSENISQTKSAG